MPLPHFLMLLAAVVLAAGLSLTLALAAGVPLSVLGLGVLVAALAAHLLARMDRAPRGPHQTPGA